MRYDDIYEEEMDYREKEWDEPGEDFGSIVITSRSTGELLDIYKPRNEISDRWYPR